ncbi:uncharacterized protein MYCFIDRAFT_145871 [Pseudocercospora fijiensis CIRAD86]|uniref:Carbohydrate esterase family 1 protein n=1 Tax=Pseudocercospora fijiensis (strain CIRAD86) TaxID=383855 RepID=M3ALV7_PSEFD|nr:uncharacterized protein MYCFIDRAFT_145871 [Pseudocercospora fijiensis CIRAD86]EME78133.1 hypothetical protein MYCFIDRAFT_145871 [Pseudocercospora fijiensis CIRAD86]
MFTLLFFLGLLAAANGLQSVAAAAETEKDHKLKVKLSVEDGVLGNSVDGRIILIFSPEKFAPLYDTVPFSTPNDFFGVNVFQFGPESSVTFSGGKADNTDFGIFGWPIRDLDDVPKGKYQTQAFLIKYENVTRSDGSMISVHFPCDDGARMPDANGSLATSAQHIEITGKPQQINLTFNETIGPKANETKNPQDVGASCAQGNYEDLDLLKYVKIRSKLLSEFWQRDMYVGANVLLPHKYDKHDTKKRYPVVYSHDHFEGRFGFAGYPRSQPFSARWNNGTSPGPNGKPDTATPEIIIVEFRHENPFYDDSYAVNSANLGPWGDAINDELIPHIDASFNTIAKPHARVLIGFSTGGWESLANLVFRPDLFGATFLSSPDPVDFTRFQSIDVYHDTDAFHSENGTANGIAREFSPNGTEVRLFDFESINHYELALGTKTRSLQQLDIFAAVFGVQGLNGYPLEPYDKLTGEIYPEATELWRPMDLTHHIISNWNSLGEVLRNRIFLTAGTHDQYYLERAVYEFQRKTEAEGGPDWANITILVNGKHEDQYRNFSTSEYIRVLGDWFQDHAGEKGKLLDEVAAKSPRGNLWSEVIKKGGHQAALARQAPPTIEIQKDHTLPASSVGRWDPGVKLQAQWFIDGKPYGEALDVQQADVVVFEPAASVAAGRRMQLRVTGRKRGYVEETRQSNVVMLMDPIKCTKVVSTTTSSPQSGLLCIRPT